ncbi:hypothetical protein BG004_006246 [Podila humilis]|nr:hypothetical protein BG004_006246 [Podila humilis]
MTTTTTTTNALHPLLLPEVLLHIGPLLSRASLMSSLLVCHTWNVHLTPFLFRGVFLPKRSIAGKSKALAKTSKRALRPLVSSLQRHGHMIRALQCEDNTLLRQITPTCTYLETLVLGKITPEVLPILKLNSSTLVRLELTPQRTQIPEHYLQRQYWIDDNIGPGGGDSASSSSSSSSTSSSRTSHASDVPVKALVEIIIQLTRLEHLVLDHLSLSLKNNKNITHHSSSSATLLETLFEFCSKQLVTLELHNCAVLDIPFSRSNSIGDHDDDDDDGTTTTTMDFSFPKLKALALVNSSIPMPSQIRFVAMLTGKDTQKLSHLTWIHQQFRVPLRAWIDEQDRYRRSLPTLSMPAGNDNDGSSSSIDTTVATEMSTSAGAGTGDDDNNNIVSETTPSPFLTTRVISNQAVTPYLRSLEISHSLLGDNDISVCLAANPQLEELVARDCRGVAERTVETILLTLTQLRVLDLRECSNVDVTAGYRILSKGVAPLRSLSLDKVSAYGFQREKALEVNGEVEVGVEDQEEQEEENRIRQRQSGGSHLSDKQWPSTDNVMERRWKCAETLEELRVVFVRPTLFTTSTSTSNPHSLKLTRLVDSNDTGNFSASDAIFYYLSKCTRLQLLSVGRTSGASKHWSALHHHHSVLELSLAAGLGRLSTLTELRELQFLNIKNCRIGMEEIKWMMKYWPKLEKLAGPLGGQQQDNSNNSSNNNTTSTTAAATMVRSAFMESYIKQTRPGMIVTDKIKYKKGLCPRRLWSLK